MTGAADTIFAVATGPVRAGIAIVRISGPEAVAVATAIAGELPPDRRAALRWLRDRTGERLDRALVLTFRGPRSYTGEDCVELHLHGGRAVVDAVLRALLAAGGRSADPGEFTRRAYLRGRVDLLEAEGIADLVAAETEAQRRQALAQASGGFSATVRDWSDRVALLLALAEAEIDFPDETGAAEPAAARDAEALSGLRDEIRRHLGHGDAARRVRDGVRIAFVGAPNVGKSSLVNRLAGREVSIVAATPGTTRDLVEAELVLSDVPVRIVDTAGWRVASEAVEREGIRRALRAVAEADLVVRVGVPDAPPARFGEADRPELLVTNKSDLGPAGAGTLRTSAATGAGIEELRAALARAVAALTARGEAPAMTDARHLDCAREAADRLDRAARLGDVPELRAEELRLARASLGRLTGDAGTEPLLDAIFSRFCIGK